MPGTQGWPFTETALTGSVTSTGSALAGHDPAPIQNNPDLPAPFSVARYRPRAVLAGPVPHHFAERPSLRMLIEIDLTKSAVGHDIRERAGRGTGCDELVQHIEIELGHLGRAEIPAG